MLSLIPPPPKPTPINLLPSLHPLLIRHAGVACGLAVVPLAAHALAHFFGEELALVVFPVGHAFFFGLAAGFAGGLSAHGGAVGGGLGVPEDWRLGSVLMGVWKLFAWSVGGGVWCWGGGIRCGHVLYICCFLSWLGSVLSRSRFPASTSV